MYRLLASETSRVLLNGTWKYKIDEDRKRTGYYNEDFDFSGWNVWIYQPIGT